MKNQTLSKWLIEVIAALFILLFVYTALSKVYEHQQFVTVLSRSPLMKSYATILSYLLPGTELLVSVLLFIPKTRLAGFWGSLVLMSAFTIYIAYMIFFTPHLLCSCGGVLKQLNRKEHLLFNIGFTLLAFLGIMLHIVNNRIFKNKNIVAQSG